MSRRLAREKILQCLFGITVGNNNPQTSLQYFQEEDISKSDLEFIENTVNGVVEHLADIDGFYVPFLKDWQFERLANIDRTILRIAVYEMRYLTSIPPTVSINEAVELAKVFGGDESPKFINAVLDQVKSTIV